MAKDYYQSENGGFRLDPSTYRMLAWQARRYPDFKQKLFALENMNPLKVKKEDIADKIDIERHIKILEESIDRYVEEPYREAVKEHSWYAVEYTDLEEKYFCSISAMKRAVQKYVWGLAQEYGEDFSRNGQEK